MRDGCAAAKVAEAGGPRDRRAAGEVPRPTSPETDARRFRALVVSSAFAPGPRLAGQPRLPEHRAQSTEDRDPTRSQSRNPSKPLGTPLDADLVVVDVSRR